MQACAWLFYVFLLHLGSDLHKVKAHVCFAHHVIS